MSMIVNTDDFIEFLHSEFIYMNQFKGGISSF